MKENLITVIGLIMFVLLLIGSITLVWIFIYYVWLWIFHFALFMGATNITVIMIAYIIIDYAKNKKDI